MLITDPPSQLARGRISDDTRRQIVTRFERSDLTQRAFCEQAGLPVSTLQWWLTQARREAARRTPVTFAEVTLPEVARPDRGVGPAWAVEVITRTGVTLRLRDPLPPAALRVLLRDVRC